MFFLAVGAAAQAGHGTRAIPRVVVGQAAKVRVREAFRIEMSQMEVEEEMEKTLKTGIAARSAAFALASAILMAAPLLATAASVINVKWEGLGIVINKTVSIAMPDGKVVIGKVLAVTPETLVVDVNRTSDARAYPLGSTRVPRTNLRRLELQTKRSVFRPVGTLLGVVVGMAVGAYVGAAHHNGLSDAGPIIALTCGGGAAGAGLGYAVGDTLAKHWTPVEISQ